MVVIVTDEAVHSSKNYGRHRCTDGVEEDTEDVRATSVSGLAPAMTPTQTLALVDASIDIERRRETVMSSG
jgi:hypothetical protein